MAENFIDQVMGFNPQDLSVFAPQTSQEGNGNSVIYKTDINLAKSEDGHYRSVVRLVLNPFDYKNSVVKSVRYSMNDGSFFQAVSSLSVGDRNCPIFKAWKSLWFSGDDNKKEFAKRKFDKSEQQWVTVQIIEDENQPDLVGQFKIWKLPTAVWEKLSAKLNPSADSKKAPTPVLDFLIGTPLEIDVTPGPDDAAHPERRKREQSYSLCDFSSDAQPVIKIGGEALFTDDELALIEDYSTARANYTKGVASGKMDAKAKAGEAKIGEIKAQITELYNKALEYCKQAAPDVQKEAGYNGWNEELTRRVTAWIDRTLAEADPTLVPNTPTPAMTNPTDFDATPAPAASTAPSEDPLSGLPF